MTFEEWWAQEDRVYLNEYSTFKMVAAQAWNEQQERIEKLLDLLDDIDTAGDMFKPEINEYFRYVQRKVGEGQQYRVEEE